MPRKRADDGPKVGHNSNLTADEKIKLSGFISEIERVDAEARELSSERGTLYKAAKEEGFDNKALRHLIKMRRMNPELRDAFENAYDAYAHAMGDFITTPLGTAMAPAASPDPMF